MPRATLETYAGSYDTPVGPLVTSRLPAAGPMTVQLGGQQRDSGVGGQPRPSSGRSASTPGSTSRSKAARSPARFSSRAGASCRRSGPTRRAEAGDEEAVEPAFRFEHAGEDPRTQPSGGRRHAVGQLAGPGGSRRKPGCRPRKAVTIASPSSRLERADRIDQGAAGPEQRGGAVEQPGLQLGAVGDD